MENQTNEELEHKSKEPEKHREYSHYEKLIFEVYYLSILQHAIYSTNHKQIAQLKEFYEKQGYNFNKYFTLAEKQLNKIENPEITLKPFIHSLTNIIKSFSTPSVSSS